MNDSLEITYAVHTAVCTFLLDAEGVCRRIVLTSSSTHSVQARARDAARAAARCVGAQYVACVDASVSGLMASTPRVGGAMLFARADERGRISLVRTGVITRFDTLGEEDPFAPGEPVPSVSVETSAPPLPATAPALAGSAAPESDPYGDDLDRTQLIRALGPGPRALRPPLAPPPSYDRRGRGILPRRSEPARTLLPRPVRSAEPGPPSAMLPYGRTGGRRR